MFGIGLRTVAVGANPRPSGFKGLADIWVDAQSAVTGSGGAVINVQASGQSASDFQIAGAGVAIEVLPDGIRFSGGQYLEHVSAGEQYTGALIIAKVTAEALPVGTSAVVASLEHDPLTRLQLRHLATGGFQGAGPNGNSIEFGGFPDPLGAQTLAFLSKQEGGVTNLTAFETDGYTVSEPVAVPTGAFVSDLLRIGQSCKIVLHQLAVFLIRDDKKLPLPAKTIWHLMSARAQRPYSAVRTEVLPVNGQSLALGPTTPDALKRQLNMADRQGTLMLTGLQAGGTPVGLTGPGAEAYDATPSDGIVPAAVTNNLCIALPIAAALNRLRPHLSAPVLTGFLGQAGQKLENMDDDETTGSGATKIADNNAYWLSQAAAQLNSAGQHAECRYTVLVQGHANKRDGAGDWKAFAEGFLNSHREAVSVAFSGANPRLVLSQTAGVYDTTSDPWYVKGDQLEFAQQTDAVLVPMYPYAVADASGTHPGPVATLEFSDTIAWAIRCDETGRVWTIYAPDVSRDGNNLTLNFKLWPGEHLVAHQSGKYDGEGINHLGFEVEGAGLLSVHVSGSEVTLECDAPPTAFRYAMQSQDMTGAQKPYPAHRGLLRTNTKETGPLSGEILHRWLPSIVSTTVV